MDDKILFQIVCILIHLYKDVNNPFTFVGCIYGAYNIDVQYFKTCHNILDNKMTTSPLIEMTLYRASICFITTRLWAGGGEHGDKTLLLPLRMYGIVKKCIL